MQQEAFKTLLGPFYGAIAVSRSRVVVVVVVVVVDIDAQAACGGSQWRMGPTFFQMLVLVLCANGLSGWGSRGPDPPSTTRMT